MNAAVGLLLCSWCHKVRREHGNWEVLEGFGSTRPGTHFTHGICPNCAATYFKEYARHVYAQRAPIHAPARQNYWVSHCAYQPSHPKKESP